MSRTPMFYTATQLCTWAIRTRRGDGVLVPCRPEGFWGLCLRWRLRAAWLVFTGRADVVQWEES